MRSRSVPAWRLAGLAGAGVLLALAILEVAIRLFAPELRGSHRRSSAVWRDNFLTENRLGRSDPELGWTLRPDAATANRSWEFEHQIRTNSLGLRDDETPYARAPGVRRLLLLGDSFAMGDGVERGEMFADRLEELLPRTEVVNLAVSGYGTDQELLAYRREGRRFLPDVVLLALTIDNDFTNNSSARQYGLNKPQFTVAEGRLRLQGVPVPANGPVKEAGPAHLPGFALHNFLDGHSAVYAALIDRLSSVPYTRPWLERQGLILSRVEVFYAGQLGILSARPNPEQERIWQVTLALLDAWRQDVVADGARPVLVLIPSHLQVDPESWQRVVKTYRLAAADYDPDYPNARLAAFCASRALVCIDLLPAFRGAERSGRSLYYRRNPHWNAAGHRLAAETIAAAIGR